VDRRRWLDRLERRIVDGLFYILLTAAVLLAGWLGARHDVSWDWTRSARNTLSAESLEVIAGLDAPLRVTVFLDHAHPLAKGIEPLLARYRGGGAPLEVRFLDPQRFPEQARAAGVSLLGQMLVEYRNRRETVAEASEAALTAAIARLARERRPWILFLEGHGERAMEGDAVSDLGRLGRLLRERGYRLRTLDLTRQERVPDNADLLVVSAPAIELFPGEAQRLTDHLAAGGNLLWLMEPGPLRGLEPLADALGITPLPGRIVDANVRRLDIDDPTVAMVERYPTHPLTRGLGEPALFPGTLAFLPVAHADWALETPLETLADSWNETGPVRGEISRDEARGEQPGPLPLALTLSRERGDGAVQRVLVMGDGDFLSNAHLGSGANRALGLRLVQWLTAPPGMDDIVPPQLADRELRLDRNAVIVLGGGSLIGLPLLFLIAGLLVRRRRTRP
jgi:hypothetical protein